MLGKAPQTKETLPDIFKIWIPINGTQQCGIEIHRNSIGGRVVNGTPGFGASQHKIMNH